MNIYKPVFQPVINIKDKNGPIVIDLKLNSNNKKILGISKKPKKENKSKTCNFEGCRKKLKITDMGCRCNHLFCTLHRLPEQHKCEYDFRQFNKECFIKQKGLGGGKADKIEKI